jgi:transcriptional regulator with XRE-family HTH domain
VLPFVAALMVRWARQDRGLSQKALGDLAGVKQQQIAKLENPDENPTLETIKKVARALGLSVNVELQSTERISMSGLKVSAGR